MIFGRRKYAPSESPLAKLRASYRSKRDIPLSQREAAASMGCDPAHLCRVERGILPLSQGLEDAMAQLYSNHSREAIRRAHAKAVENRSANMTRRGAA